MRRAGRFGAFRLAIELPLVVTAEGPLLIRGPDAFVPDAPDMAFVRYPTEYGDVPFLPGSSLKGVLRSGVEMLLRGLGRRACRSTDPSDACQKAEDRCLGCLLFGSREGASVIAVEDGLPWPQRASREERAEAAEAIREQRTVRAGVGIDRQTGSVRVGPFDYELLVGTTFYPTLRLRNPEPWQAAAVAAGLLLLDRGVLRIGSGTSRGLGRVSIDAEPPVVLALESEAAEPFLVSDVLVGPERDFLFVRFTATSSKPVLERWAARLEEWLDVA